MGLNGGESLMRLTASCEIAVGNIGRRGGSVVVEITQRHSEGTDVTTLLLCPEKARELASVLLRHSCHVRPEERAEGARREEEEVRRVRESIPGRGAQSACL